MQISTEGPAQSTVKYHLQELEIARDTHHPGHLMPPIEAKHRAILDVGCGMGQTLLAAELPEDVEAYGVDIDAGAVEAGRGMLPPNIRLEVSGAEELPFPNEMFDFVYCRGAMPYMHIARALGEMRRVLRPGGEFWLSLHPWEMLQARTKESLRSGNLKDALFCGFVAVNGAVLHLLGRQMRVGWRRETFQTVNGMRKALDRAGLQCTGVEQGRHFIVQGRRPK